MRNKLKIFLPFLLLALFVSQAHAAKRYWVAVSTANWNNTTNWSATSGGGGGSSVPGSSDTAYYDGNGVGNCTINTTVSVKRFDVAAGYSGTISQGANTVTIGTGNGVLSGGIFTGGSSNISVAGSLTISGTAFTSTSASLTLSSDFTISSGSFADNSGTVVLTSTSTLTVSNIGGTSFYDLTFVPSATTTITLASTTAITVSHTLTYDGSYSFTLNSGTLDVTGDITILNNHSGPGGTSTLVIDGSGSQTITGTVTDNLGPLPSVVINKSTGTLYLVNSIAIGGDWTYTSGTISPGSSTLYFVGDKTITGSLTLNNISFNGNWGYTYIIDGGTTLTATGTVTIDGAYGVTLNTGTINAQGDITITNTSIAGGGSAAIVIDGTGNQTLTGSGTASQGRLPNVTINKSSGTLTLASIISVFGDWTYTTGTISPGSSTVYFVSDKTITGSHTLANVTFISNWSDTYVIAGGTTLTVTGTLTIDGSYPVTINTGTINAKGDITILNTSTSGSGSVSLVINGTGNQTLTGSGTSGEGRLPNTTINKSSGTLTLASIISVAGDWTYTTGTINTGSSTVFFTGDKTITGSHTLANVTFFGNGGGYTYIIAGGTTLTITGTLTIDGPYQAILNTGTIDAHGDINVTNTSSGAMGTASLVINGTGNQSITGSGVAGEGRLPQITIDKSSGTLTLNSLISVYGDWIYTQGTVAPGTSTVALYGTFNLDGQAAGSSNTMSFYKLAIAANTRTLTGNIDVKSVLTISSGATFTAGSYSINTWGWNGQGTWNYNTSTVTFDGSGYSSAKSATGTSANFYDVGFNRSSGSILLQNPLIVNHVMTLTKGHVKTTSTNYLTFIDNATCTGGSDTAFVHGPVRKTGNDAFIFPLGDTALTDSSAYHPLAITAPSSTSDQFEATYFAHNQTSGDSLVDTLASVSDCEYWNLERRIGSSNIKATLSWNRNSCNIDEFDDLRVGGWDGYKWVDEGQDALTINTNTGTVQSSLTIDFSVHALRPLALSKGLNTQPYAILKKKIDAGYFSVTNGKLMFKFDEEYNDPDSKLSFKIYNDSYQEVGSSSTVVTGYQPLVYPGSNYYLLNVLNCNVMPAGVLPSGFYILEVVNDKNEHWYLRFKHTTSLTINCDDDHEEE
jgi:hypothetical protein